MSFGFTRAALAAALALGAAPAIAAEADFESRLAAAIDRAMVAPADFDRTDSRGVATVGFTIGQDGRADRATLVESSGSRALDRAALRTVERLRLPAGAPSGPHLAVLQYDSTIGEAEVDVAAARRAAPVNRAQLALRDASGRDRLLGGGAGPVAISIDD